VLQYTGAKRALNKPDFNKYDFAVTTYSTLEADYRKHIMPPKIRCQYCNKLFYPDKMKVHLTYFCGPDALRTEKQAKQKSKSWGDKKRTRKGKKSGGVDDDEDDLEEFEELAPQSRGKSPLHSVRWERIILDEVIIRCPVYVLLLHFQYYCFNNTINCICRCNSQELIDFTNQHIGVLHSAIFAILVLRDVYPFPSTKHDLRL
jgi:hypothetical protein